MSAWGATSVPACKESPTQARRRRTRQLAEAAVALALALLFVGLAHFFATADRVLYALAGFMLYWVQRRSGLRLGLLFYLALSLLCLFLYTPLTALPVAAVFGFWVEAVYLGQLLLDGRCRRRGREGDLERALRYHRWEHLTLRLALAIVMALASIPFVHLFVRGDLGGWAYIFSAALVPALLFYDFCLNRLYDFLQAYLPGNLGGGQRPRTGQGRDLQEREPGDGPGL